ncbi:MAG: YqiA/YcfP family alpha/beta fold hydrolase [Flavobacteriales bacterium]
MNQSITHVFFVPGLAAGKSIFKNIKLPESQYKMHILEWLIPYKNESLEAYAKRMAKRVKEPNIILIGVSFGGIVVQEMSQFLNLKKVIIISSVKTKHELPQRMKIASKTKAYKLIPTKIISQSKDLTKFAIGKKSRKRLALYNEYLSVRNKQYLDWAIKQMVCWKRDTAIKKLAHIHGNKDAVFPIKNIKDVIIVDGGTHVMLVYNAKIVTQELLNIFNN